MQFWLGTHVPSWLERTDVALIYWEPDKPWTRFDIRVEGPTHKCNGALIAKAPELLAALEEAALYVWATEREKAARYQALIKAARGEA